VAKVTKNAIQISRVLLGRCNERREDDIVGEPKDALARAKEKFLRVVSQRTSIFPRGHQEEKDVVDVNERPIHQSFDVIRTRIAEESRRPRWRFRRTLLRVKTRRAVMERKKRRTTETDRHFDRRERDVPLQTAHV
jgi:hypothetical protein